MLIGIRHNYSLTVICLQQYNSRFPAPDQTQSILEQKENYIVSGWGIKEVLSKEHYSPIYYEQEESE